MREIKSNNEIIIYSYPLTDFNISDKAIWINTRMDTPEVRLPSLYDRIFIPKSLAFIDNKSNRLFISKKMIDKIILDYKKDHIRYKYSLSAPIIHNINFDRWKAAMGLNN